MQWLPLYADESDLAFIHSWLNSQEEIAFIVSDGDKRWKAVKTISELRGPRHCLWHIPSGPLPLPSAPPSYFTDQSNAWHPFGYDEPDGVVEDPWAGWQELRTGADPTQPYFGTGHPGVYWLNVHPDSCEGHEGIGLSGFEWIGNYYRCIGRPAPECAEKWWNTLKRWIRKQATKVPRGGPGREEEYMQHTANKQVWAFPSALDRIRRGCPHDVNPF